MGAYTEFEAQPNHRMEYTARLDLARRNRTPKFKSVREKGREKGIQIVIDKRRTRMGVMMKRRERPLMGGWALYW